MNINDVIFVAGHRGLVGSSILKLLNDTGLLNTFKANALSHAKTFDVVNILPKYKSIYEQLCSIV